MPLQKMRQVMPKTFEGTLERRKPEDVLKAIQRRRKLMLAPRSIPTEKATPQRVPQELFRSRRNIPFNIDRSIYKPKVRLA